MSLDETAFAVTVHLSDGTKVRANPTDPMSASDLTALRRTINARLSAQPTAEVPEPERCLLVGAAGAESLIPVDQVVRITWRPWEQ